MSPEILRYQTRIGRQGDMQKSCGVSYVDFRPQTQRNVKMLPGLKNIPGQPRGHCCWLWQECLAGRLAMGIQVYVYRVCFTNLIQLFVAGSHPCSPFTGWILLGKSKPKAMFICPKCSFLFADFPSIFFSNCKIDRASPINLEIWSKHHLCYTKVSKILGNTQYIRPHPALHFWVEPP